MHIIIVVNLAPEVLFSFSAARSHNVASTSCLNSVAADVLFNFVRFGGH